MWKLNGKPLDWARPRQQYGVAVKNSAGNPVSDYNGWNWHGEKPASRGGGEVLLGLGELSVNLTAFRSNGAGETKPVTKTPAANASVFVTIFGR